MAETYLAVISYRTGDAEALQTDTDGLGCISSCLNTLLDGDSGTTNVCPLSILEADTLSLFAHQIRINTSLFADLISLFYATDTICIQSSQHLLLAALLAFITYFSNHSCVSPYSLRGSIDLTTPCSAVVRP